MRQNELIKKELINQLRIKTRQQSFGLKLMIWGGVIRLLNLLLDGLYSAFRLLSWRGDLGENRKEFFDKFSKFFLFFFLVWMLIWVIVVILVGICLSKWLKSRSEIKQIKLELENLK